MIAAPSVRIDRYGRSTRTMRSWSIHKAAICVTCAFAFALMPRPAHASEKWWHNLYISQGIVWSSSKAPISARGNGFEFTAGYSFLVSSLSAPKSDGLTTFLLSPHVAILYRNQSYHGDSGDFIRQTFGLQGGAGLLGLELGYTWRDGFRTTSARNGVHISPYVSIAALYVGPQWTLGPGGAPEYAFNVGLKLPLPAGIALDLMNSDLFRFLRRI